VMAYYLYEYNKLSRGQFLVKLVFFMILVCLWSLEAKAQETTIKRESTNKSNPIAIKKNNTKMLHKRVLHVRKLEESPTTVNILRKDIKGTYLSGDNYAAMVNSKVITLLEFNEALSHALKQLGNQENQGFSSVAAKESTQETKQTILSELIDSRLIFEEADKMEIEVPTSHIKQKISEIRKGFPSEELFQNAIEEEGIHLDTLKEGIRQQILIDMISERLAREYDISDEQIWHYYNNHKEMFIQPERIRVLKIILNSHSEAQSLLRKIKEGQSFEDIQRKYSLFQDDPTNMMEEELERGQMPAKEEKILFHLTIDDISPVLEIANQFVIYKILEKRPKAYVDAKEAKEKIKKYLQIENQQNIYHDWLKDVREKADIRINPIFLLKNSSSKVPSNNGEELLTPGDHNLKKKKFRLENEGVPRVG